MDALGREVRDRERCLVEVSSFFREHTKTKRGIKSPHTSSVKSVSERGRLVMLLNFWGLLEILHE